MHIFINKSNIDFFYIEIQSCYLRNYFNFAAEKKSHISAAERQLDEAQELVSCT